MDLNTAQIMDGLAILAGVSIAIWIFLGMPYAPGIAGGRR